MSQKIGNITIISEEKPQECDMCGKIDKLRPYGPNFSKVCFNCSMKDPVGTEIRMGIKLFGETLEEATKFAHKKYGIK